MRTWSRMRLGLALFLADECGAGLFAENATSLRATLLASTEYGWPQFRGPRRDGVSDERGLQSSWPEGGPRKIWSTTGAGKGFSSPIVAGGRVYVTGDFGEDLFVLAYDLNGKPLWRTRHGAAWLNQYQGARASVTYSEGRLYLQNAHGRVGCFDAATGEEKWQLNTLERFRGENITWGLSECVLVDERAVYVTAGGRDALVVALDKRNGEVLWRSEPLMGAKGEVETAGYATPIMVRFAGRRLIVGCSAGNLYGVDADTGKLQWSEPRPTSYSVLAMTPVLVRDGVFMSAPFGPPGALHAFVAPANEGERVSVTTRWTASIDPAQGGMVQAADRLFGAYYPRRGGWAALDASTGKTLFENRELLKGCAVYADSRLYVLCEDGWMILFDVSGARFEERGRFRLAVARDRDAWAHPVICDGRLYLRYHDTIACYEIRAAR